MEQYSFSKINMYTYCPFQYKCRYVDYISVPIKECFKHGSLIHRQLENFNNTDTLQSPVLKEFFNTDLGKEIQEILLHNTTAKRESRFGLTKDLKNIEYSKGFFRGIIDLYYKTDNNITIVDYKSGKYHSEQDFTQLTAYSRYLMNLFDTDQVTVRYIYVEHAKENTKIVTKSDTDKAFRDIFKTIYDINFDSTYKGTVDEKCKYCQYNFYCPFYSDKRKLDMS